MSLRALISPDVEDFQIDKSLVIGVWGNRARLLVPTSETLPTSWRDWRGAFGNIISKPWMYWKESITSDFNPLLFHYELRPCRICSQAIRAPPTAHLLSAGVHAEWWEQWNPIAHTNPYPSGREFSSDRACYFERPFQTTQYNGRGAVSAHSAAALGSSTLPDC